MNNCTYWVKPATGRVFEIYKECGIRALQCCCKGYRRRGGTVHLLDPFEQVNFTSAGSFGYLSCRPSFDFLRIPPEKFLAVEVPWQPWMDITVVDLRLNRELLRGLRWGLPKKGVWMTRHAL
jgi:hypothetical protein